MKIKTHIVNGQLAIDPSISPALRIADSVKTLKKTAKSGYGATAKAAHV